MPGGSSSESSPWSGATNAGRALHRRRLLGARMAEGADGGEQIGAEPDQERAVEAPEQADDAAGENAEKRET